MARVSLILSPFKNQLKNQFCTNLLLQLPLPMVSPLFILPVYHVCLLVCLFVYLLVVFVVDVEGSLSKALLVGNFEAAVDICIGDNRMVRNSSSKKKLYS